eukprot:TRINITY_DN1325_c0_g1_i1.p2 TRINITY_DN1325_c0_g1~~TRINITY_DN1325_c0_g1_i1.p2  ORF type:complete len:249 (+),score=94.53 TRINITY_DN1325_c0_g1_i1:1304-2050(+)
MNHLCMVFEPMMSNLRDLVSKYGKGIGLNISVVQLYGSKLFTALKLVKRCEIVHADIKLDNILVNEAMSTVRLADFGSAALISEGSITPYLVSRFYRAPEIMLGLQYDYAIDTWSLGCCLYELYTSKILFPGRSNNDMLRHIMDLKGPFPKRVLKNASFRDQHFDENNCFLLREKDPVKDQELVRVMNIIKPVMDVKTKLLSCMPPNHTESERTKVVQLADLLEKCFNLSPQARITPEEAVRHPFFQS